MATDKILAELDLLRSILENYEYYNDFGKAEQLFLSICIHNLINANSDINKSLLDKHFKQSNDSVHCFLLIYSKQSGNWIDKFEKSVILFNQAKDERYTQCVNMGYRDKTSPIYDRILVSLVNSMFAEKTEYKGIKSKLKIDISEILTCPKCGGNCIVTDIDKTQLWECDDCSYLDAKD